jgi:hypothetical protein
MIIQFRFITSFAPEWHLDREIILILICVALFAPAPRVIDQAAVARRRHYLRLLMW